MRLRKAFPGVWKSGKRVFTENLIPGEKIFTKNLVKRKGREYREWDPFRSKPAAAILKGIKIFPVKKDSKILYLGISQIAQKAT